jgi:hypothetical protein
VESAQRCAARLCFLDEKALLETNFALRWVGVGTVAYSRRGSSHLPAGMIAGHVGVRGVVATCRRLMERRYMAFANSIRGCTGMDSVGNQQCVGWLL